MSGRETGRHVITIVLAFAVLASVISPPGAQASVAPPSLASPATPRQSAPATPGQAKPDPRPDRLDAPSLGRLLFAPAIDADGDAATNPVLNSPVPIIDLAGALGGVVWLAAQLEPLDPSASLIGVPVTLRVWREDGMHAVESRLVPSDEWGAVTLNLPLRELGGEYAYQASAPGYGVTEVRRFRFDLGHASYTLHRKNIPLWQSRRAPGRFVFTLRSPKPLVAGRDRPELLIARLPEARPGITNSMLSPVLADISAARLGLPFPRVAMRIAGTYTATVEVQLPPGDYSVIASLELNTSPAGQYYSQITRVVVGSNSSQPAGAAQWVSPVEYEPGRVLVQHRAPEGRAAFSVVDMDRAPEVGEDLTPPTAPQHFDQMVRTGPFQWRRISHDIEVKAASGDGKKTAWVESIDHTPLRSRYTIAIRSFEPRAYTDTLRVDVFGPANIVLMHRDEQVELRPDRLTHYTFDVPTELGAPKGLRITLDDPTIQDIVDTIRETLVSTSPQITLSGSIRLFAQVIGIVLFECAWKIPDDKGECEFLPNGGSTLGLVWDIAAYLAQEGFQLDEENPLRSRLKLGTGGVGADAAIGVSINVPTVCYDPVSLKALEDSLSAASRDANAVLNAINEKIKAVKPSKLPDVPLFWIISVWGEFSFGLSISTEAEGTRFKVDVGVFLSIVAVIGIALPLQAFQLEDIDKIYKMLTHVSALHGALMTIIQNVRALWRGDPRCRPNWPDNKPADDRQDVWQDLEGLYDGNTADETISNLTDLIQRARARGLSLAERWLNYELRNTEISRHVLDTTAMQAYGLGVVRIMSDTATDVQGFISGTIAISPSQTISDAVVARIERAIADVEAMPYRRARTQLLAAQSVATRQYNELFGQELALRHELSLLFTHDVIGVLASGFAPATLNALKLAGLPAQLISPFPGAGDLGGLPAPYVPPADAPRALVVPSGGMRLVANSPEARAWLDEYVRSGGLLVVFTQMLGDDWAVLPGGAVRAVGYEEDQRCEQESVRPAAASSWLTWVGIATPDIQVDGAFLAWPENATVLLARTSGTYAGYPAMIEYPYGQGRVLATTAYGDWAVTTGIAWGDDWHLTRSVLIRAYLLSQGLDAGDAVTVSPGLTATLAVQVTNTTSLTATHVTVELPYQATSPYASAVVRAIVPVSLAPGASTSITAALRIPSVMRGVHNWTRVGLFRLRTVLQDANGNSQSSWGSFLWSVSPISPTHISIGLSTNDVAGRAGQTIALTATVRSFSATVQTVRLRGIVDLPTTTITLTVPANGSLTYPYTVTLDRAKRPSAGIYNTSNGLLSQSSLGVSIAEPSLRVEPVIPPILASGAIVQARVSNRASPNQPAAAALGGTLAISLAAPGGSVLWSGSQPVPALPLGASASVSFALGALTLNELGDYAIEYRLVDNASVAVEGRWPIPSRLAIDGVFDRPSYRVRETGVFTARVRNTGYVALSPLVTITIPALALTWTQQVSLPVSGSAVVSIAFALPTGMVAGPTPVDVTVGVSATGGLTESFASFGLVIASSSIDVLDAAPGLHHAGETLTATLLNVGGVDTSVTYTMRLVDVRSVRLAEGSGATSTPVGARTVISLNLPAGMASGSYWLSVAGRDQDTQRSFSAGFLLAFDGIGATIDVKTDRPDYAISQTVFATGRVTATQGSISGLLRLSVSTANGEEFAVGPKTCVNTVRITETGFINHTSPSMAMDSAGNAYAVWQDYRNSHTDGAGVDLYFSRRLAGGEWGPNELVNMEPITQAFTQAEPDIAVDAAGNAYAVWSETRPGTGSDVYFAYRPASGVWSAPVKVNDDTGTADQTSPAIGVDAAGNAYAVWQDTRSFTLGDIYFAYRPVTGTWGANVKVNDGVNAYHTLPDIAVTPAGDAWAVWRDQRNPTAAIYAAFRPLAGAWGGNERVNSGATIGLSPPAVAVDANATAHAVWASGSIYYTTRPLTGTWSTQARVNDSSPGAKANPVIAVSAPNVAYAAWDDARVGTYTSIYFASLLVTGTWGTNVRVNDDPITNSRYHDAPAIAASPSGLVVAWEDNRQAPGYNEIYGAARAPDGVWTANAIVNDDHGGSVQNRPDIAVDGFGYAYAAWVDGRSCVLCGYSLGNAVFSSRWLPGSGWESETEVYRSVQYPDSTALGADGAGNTHVVWKDYLEGSGVPRVFRSSRAPDGAWEPGSVLSLTVRDQRNPDIAVDRSGNFVAIWDQYNFGLHFADRPAGGPWGPGQIITSQYGYDSAIAVDQAGAAYAIWAAVNPNDIWSAYRPPGGVWNAAVKVNDETPNASQNGPSIAVDGNGAVYAAWADYRNSLTLADVYFAYRQPGGPWSPNLRVTAPMTCTNAHPAIAADPAGNVFLVWANCQGVFLVLRDLTGMWSTPVKVSNLGDEPSIALSPSGDVHVIWSQRTPGANGPDTPDIYHAVIGSPVKQTVLWTRDIAIDLNAPASQIITQVVGALGGQPGKYWLTAQLLSALSQTLSLSRTSFYISPNGAALTLQTDRPIYRPGQVVNVTGRVTNTTAAPATLNLLVSAGGRNLISQTLPLGAGQGAPYATAFTATTSVLITATAGSAHVSESALVVAPWVVASLGIPAVVGSAPFSATLTVTNTGEVDASLVVTVSNTSPASLTLKPGETGIVARSVAITSSTQVTARIGGDASYVVSQLAQYGEGATLLLTPPESTFAGTVAIGYVISGSGALPTLATLSYRIDSGATLTDSAGGMLAIEPGRALIGALLVNAPAGSHRLDAELRGPGGQVFSQSSLTLVLTPTSATLAPSFRILGVRAAGSLASALSEASADLGPQLPDAGQAINLLVDIANDGPSAPAVIDLQVFDLPQQWIITPAAYITQTYALSLNVPVDIPAGAYVGQVGAGDQTQPFTMSVAGANVGLALQLDKPAYMAGSRVLLTATLTERAARSGSYHLSLRYLDSEAFVTVTVGANQVVRYTFAFTATATDRASVILAMTPPAGEQSQRTIMIDSLPVEVIEPARGAYLTFGRTPVYQAGETARFTATITGVMAYVSVIGPLELALSSGGMLMWSAPLTDSGVLTGTFPLSFTFPAPARSGRYTFLLQMNGDSQPYEVDVRGWNVLARRMFLDTRYYGQRDAITASVEFMNETTATLAGAQLGAYVVLPDGGGGIDLSPIVSRAVNLQPGLNILTVAGAFTTPVVGPHQLIVELRQPGSAVRLAGASAQFDVGQAHLVALTTDRGNYAPGEPGAGQLDVAGHGPAQLVVTATNGAVVFSQMVTLDGFASYSFTIPTASYGDYVLVGRSIDATGNADQLIRAYAVPLPHDTLPPTLTVAYPNIFTVITTSAPTLTISVRGRAEDDRGTVSVLVNGQTVTPSVNSDFTATLAVQQGANLVSVVALDAAGNIAFAPMTEVQLVPLRALNLSANRNKTWVGDRLMFQVVLTGSAPVSDVAASMMLPTAIITDVTASATSGRVSVFSPANGAIAIQWSEAAPGPAPATLSVSASVWQTDTLSATVRTLWPWGVSDVAFLQLEVLAGLGNHAYLPIARGGRPNLRSFLPMVIR